MWVGKYIELLTVRQHASHPARNSSPWATSKREEEEKRRKRREKKNYQHKGRF